MFRCKPVKKDKEVKCASKQSKRLQIDAEVRKKKKKQ